MINKKSTSVAYTILNKTLNAYHSKWPLENLDLFIKDLRESGQKALAEDPAFPIEFYRECEHQIIRWCIDGFAGLEKDRIGVMLQRIWAFHKVCMEHDFSDQSMDELLATAEDLVKGIESKEEQGLYVAVLHDYERASKEVSK